MNDRREIVVGIDGTLASQGAVDWALAHRDAFGPVRPVYAWDYPIMATAGTPFGYAAIPPTVEMQDAAERAAHEFAASVDGLDTPVLTVRGDPGAALCAEAAGATMLVIGTRGRGALRAAILGSVGRYCADHAPVPLVIVPRHEDGEENSEADDAADFTETRRILVGVDGSDPAFESLLWAIQTFPDAAVTALTAWQTPIDAPVLFGGDRFDVAQFRAHAKAVVNEAADNACSKAGVAAERIQRRVAEGDPRWVLLAAQDDVDLLVLGRRGRTGLKHLILGSTTTSLIHQPHCPVAVIPTEDHDD